MFFRVKIVKIKFFFTTKNYRKSNSRSVSEEFVSAKKMDVIRYGKFSWKKIGFEKMKKQKILHVIR